MNVRAFSKRHTVQGDRGPIDVDVSIDGVALYVGTADGRMSFSDFGKVATVVARFQADVAHVAVNMHPGRKG